VSHDYDAVGQLTGLLNDVTSRRSDRYGGRVEQHFQYDALERLTSASGTWNRPEGGTDSYSLGMAYDDLHNITRKTQTHEVTTRGNSHPIRQHATTYDLTYAYGGTRPHAPTQIGTATFDYDANGNQTEREDQPATQRRRTEWDEESLPRAITVAGHRTEFVYDSGGTRVAKSGAQGETVYVNPTWTVRNGTMATKHIYVGGRLVCDGQGRRALRAQPVLREWRAVGATELELGEIAVLVYGDRARSGDRPIRLRSADVRPERTGLVESRSGIAGVSRRPSQHWTGRICATHARTVRIRVQQSGFVSRFDGF